MEWPSRIAFFSGLVMSWTARRPSTKSRIAGDSASYAAYMLAKQVSPPTAGQLHRAQDRSHRRVGEERVVAVPLVGAFALRVHLVEHDDLGRVLVDGLRTATRASGRSAARTRCCSSSVIVLVAEEEHEVVEQRLAQDLDVDVGELLAQVDAARPRPRSPR